MQKRYLACLIIELALAGCASTREVESPRGEYEVAYQAVASLSDAHTAYVICDICPRPTVKTPFAATKVFGLRKVALQPVAASGSSGPSAVRPADGDPDNGRPVNEETPSGSGRPDDKQAKDDRVGTDPVVSEQNPNDEATNGQPAKTQNNPLGAERPGVHSSAAPPASPSSSVTAVPIARVHFRVNESKLLPESAKSIDASIGDIKAASRIRVDGYTDDTGSEAYNGRLALQRANSVKAYLVEKHRMEGSSIVATGKGKCCYTHSNDSEDGRRANRRSEIVQDSPTHQ